MEVRQVPAANATQPVVRPQMQARSSRGRRRSNNNPSGTQRNNRQRTDRGSTIQDHIDQGRRHLDTITGHLGTLTQSVVNGNQSGLNPNPWSRDPVGNARQLTDSMISIAVGLGSPQAREARERSLMFLNGIMNQAAGNMGINLQTGGSQLFPLQQMPPMSPIDIRNLSNNENRGSNLTNESIGDQFASDDDLDT